MHSLAPHLALSADPVLSIPPVCSMAAQKGTGWKELCVAYKAQGKGLPTALILKQNQFLHV